jgi:hypothetical protein
MIARRQVMAGALALLAPWRAFGAALPLPPSDRLGFDVWLAKRKLGTHDLVFHRATDGGLVVDITVDIAFRVGPITLYRYTHQAQERWAGGEVIRLSTTTLDNGTRHRVEGHREASGLIIQPEGKPAYLAPADALPATHWNHRELDGPLINTQTGELLRPRIAPEGPGTVTTATGHALRVNRYALTGPIALTLWYDEAQEWAGLSFTKAGAEVHYARRG